MIAGTAAGAGALWAAPTLLGMSTPAAAWSGTTAIGGASVTTSTSGFATSLPIGSFGAGMLLVVVINGYDETISIAGMSNLGTRMEQANCYAQAFFRVLPAGPTAITATFGGNSAATACAYHFPTVTSPPNPGTAPVLGTDYTQAQGNSTNINPAGLTAGTGYSHVLLGGWQGLTTTRTYGGNYPAQGVAPERFIDRNGTIRDQSAFGNTAFQPTTTAQAVTLGASRNWVAWRVRIS